jgi:hypothetical protein
MTQSPSPRTPCRPARSSAPISAKPSWPAVQDLGGENRHENLVWPPHKTDNTQKDQQSANRPRAQHKPESLDDRVEPRPRVFGGRLISDSDHHEADDHGKKADGVQKETPRFPDRRDQHTGNCRPDDSGSVHHRRIQRDRVHKVVAPDHLDNEGLANGNIESAYYSKQTCEQNDVPALNAIRKRERREQDCEYHRRYLHNDERPAPRMAVGERTAHRRKQEDRKLRRETHYAEHRGRSRQSIDEPRLRYGLHPGPGQRYDLPEKVQTIIAMAKRPQCHSQSRFSHRRFNYNSTCPNYRTFYFTSNA